MEWGMTIRKASPVDLVYVNASLNPGTPFRSSLPDPAVTRIVAERHGQILGFVEIIRHPPEDAPYVGYWLSSLYVLDPLFRGLGIGEALASHIIEIARIEGAKELWLLVVGTNRPAVALYRKLGFVEAIVEDLEEVLEGEALTTGSRRLAMVKRVIE